MLIADINRLLSVNIYIYSQLPTGRTRKGPGNVSDLSKCLNYQRFRISWK